MYNRWLVPTGPFLGLLPNVLCLAGGEWTVMPRVYESTGSEVNGTSRSVFNPRSRLRHHTESTPFNVQHPLSQSFASFLMQSRIGESHDPSSIYRLMLTTSQLQSNFGSLAYSFSICLFKSTRSGWTNVEPRSRTKPASLVLRKSPTTNAWRFVEEGLEISSGTCTVRALELGCYPGSL